MAYPSDGGGVADFAHPKAVRYLVGPDIGALNECVRSGVTKPGIKVFEDKDEALAYHNKHGGQFGAYVLGWSALRDEWRWKARKD
jgi:hypothetical protein